MSELYLTQRVRDEMLLVSLVIVQFDFDRAMASTRLMFEAIDLIRKNPTAGKLHTWSGFALSPNVSDKPIQLLAPREFWTFDLSKLDVPMPYQFLYRVDDSGVEVGRLLHLAMDFRQHIPVEWVVEMMHGDAA